MMSYVSSFGACVLGSTQRCVISPDLCQSGESYLPAFETSTCAHPADLRTGRCTGSADDFRCAVTRDVCYYPTSFDVTGGTGSKKLNEGVTLRGCNLQYGEGDAGFTIFAGCRDQSLPSRDDSRLRCLLFKGDCVGPTQDWISATWLYDWKTTDSCKCHDVHVGLCYPTSLSVDEITSENSYCATGAWDCREGTHAFLTATDVHFLPVDMQCRLCQDTDLKGGACVDTVNQNVQQCALESSTCPSSSEFLSSRQLDNREDRNARVQCSSPLKTKLGACASSLDDADCVAHEDACWYSHKFEKRDKCNLMENEETNYPTYFGSCHNKPDEKNYVRKERCVWASEDCDDTLELYRAARVPNNWWEGCTCENVKLGACVEEENNASYCAVSARACSPGDTFVRALDFASHGLDGLDCRLCRDRATVYSPTNPLTGEQVSAPSGAVSMDDAVDKSRSMSTAMIVLISLGCGFALFLVMVLIVSVAKHKKEESVVFKGSNDVQEVDKDKVDLDSVS